MLSRRWQFGNVHLLPSGDVFSAFATGTPYRGDSLHTSFGEQGNSETSGRIFLLPAYHKTPQTLQSFPRVLDNLSYLELLWQPAGRERISLFTRKTPFTGDTQLVLGGRKAFFFVFVHSTEVSPTIAGSYGAYFFISQKYPSNLTQSRDTVERPETGQGVAQ